MKIIEVIFTNTRRDPKITETKYLFLCNNLEVCIGDLITDHRYSTKLLVVNIYDKDTAIQNGYILKKVCVTKIEHKTRAILIDLEKARNWYFSDNATLKALALSVYNESELCNSYEYISKQVDVKSITLRVPFENHMFFIALSKLSTIANYYNNGWKKIEFNTGYFIGKSAIGVKAVETSYKDIYIFKHDNVKYPGIVYFKNKEDAIKALHILNKEDLNNLF